MFHQTYHTKNFDNLNPDAGVMACSATIKLLVSHAHAAPTERLENNLTLQGSFFTEVYNILPSFCCCVLRAPKRFMQANSKAWTTALAAQLE
jgi:hypothetical protein